MNGITFGMGDCGMMASLDGVETDGDSVCEDGRSSSELSDMELFQIFDEYEEALLSDFLGPEGAAECLSQCGSPLPERRGGFQVEDSDGPDLLSGFGSVRSAGGVGVGDKRETEQE